MQIPVYVILINAILCIINIIIRVHISYTFGTREYYATARGGCDRGGCRPVGRSGGAGERQTVIIFRRERARTHAYTHPHPPTRGTDYANVYGGEINLFYILLLLLLFPSRALSVKRYRRGNLFGRIYGEEQSNCRRRRRRWRILTNKIILYILYERTPPERGGVQVGIRTWCGAGGGGWVQHVIPCEKTRGRARGERTV